MVSTKRRKNSIQEVGEVKTRQDYPCSFRGILTLLHDLGPKIRDDHVKVLKDTPFWAFIDCIRRGVVDNRWTQKHEKDVALVINCFDKMREEFLFGEVALAPQDIDVKLVFGIRDGPTEIVVPREPTEIGVISRRYPEKLEPVSVDGNGKRMYCRLTVSAIAKTLREIVGSRDEVDVKDFARLLTLHVIATFFAPVRGGFGWGYFDFIEDIESMCEYNWSKYILQQLMDCMRLNNDKHTGCVMFLLYWLCEKTRMVKSTRVDFMPRFAKWNLRVLNDVLGDINLQKLDKKMVITTPVRMTVAESTFHKVTLDTNEPLEHSMLTMFLGESSSNGLGESSKGKKRYSEKKDLKEVVTEVEKENMNLKEVVKELEKENMYLKAVGKDVEKGNEYPKEVEMENMNLKQVVKEIEKENMNLKEEMKDKDKLLRDIRSLLKMKAANAENKDQEIKILEGLNDFMEAKLEKITKENDDLKQRLSQLNREHGAMVYTEEGGGKKQKTVH